MTRGDHLRFWGPSVAFRQLQVRTVVARCAVRAEGLSVR